MYRVCKSFTFDAAHHLPDYPGPCVRLHGHTWRVELCVYSEVLERGMVMDFGSFEPVIQRVKTMLDHHNVNDVIPYPTAENIARWIFDMTQERGWNVQFVRVWESDSSYAEYSR